MDWGKIAGWSGAVLGTVLGIAGGVFGIWCSLRNSRGPRERAVVIRGAVAVSLLVVLLLAGLLLIPPTYALVVWIPYVALLLLGIRYFNRQQIGARANEADGSGQSPS